jgi:phage shock protein A
MNVWAKMVTALKGGVNEAGELVVDHQALRILDQEMREADAELRQSKSHLVELMAQHKVAADKMTAIGGQIQEYEGYAIQALGKGDEALALEVSGKIAELEKQHVDATGIAAAAETNVTRLKLAVNQAEANLQRLKQQVDTVKANQSVLRAQKTVAERYSGSDSRLQTALETLERIKSKQEIEAARLDAARQIVDEKQHDPLKQKLENAGIIGTRNQAADVLARIKAKQP